MGEALITRRGGGGMKISGYVEREAVAVDDIAANHSCYVQDFTAMPGTAMPKGMIAYTVFKDGVMFAIHSLVVSNAWKSTDYGFYSADALERIKGVVAEPKAFPKAPCNRCTIHKIDTDHFIVKATNKDQVDVYTIDWVNHTISSVTLTLPNAAGNDIGMCISVTPNRTPYVFVSVNATLHAYRVDNATSNSPTLTACGSLSLTTVQYLYVCALTDNIFGVIGAREYSDCYARVIKIEGASVTSLASKTMPLIAYYEDDDGCAVRCGQLGQIEPEFYKGEYIQPYVWWEAVSGSYCYYGFFKYNPTNGVATITDTVCRPPDNDGFDDFGFPIYGLAGLNSSTRASNAHLFVHKRTNDQNVKLLTIYPDTGGTITTHRLDSDIAITTEWGIGRAYEKHGYVIMCTNQSGGYGIDVLVNLCRLPVASLYFGSDAGLVTGRSVAGEQVSVQVLDPTVDN